MNIGHKKHRFRSWTVGMLALAASPLVLSQAHAALGEDVASVASDQVRMQAKLQILNRDSYAIHELQMPMGAKVREFVGHGGKVFAVSWSGGWRPNLRDILVFGIGTQANNGLGGATVFALDNSGYVETAFPVGGTHYTSYLDSGSNALFFLDEATTKIPTCAADQNVFYCPPSLVTLNATIFQGSTSSTRFTFSVANADQLAARNFAFNNLAGPMVGYPDPTQPSFDWGLPFFFGRIVFSAIDTRSTPSGAGPYFAF